MDILEIYNQHNNFGRLLNMTYEVMETGKVAYHLKITSDLLATPIAAHGGAIAGFMDAIVGVAALSAVAPLNKVVSTIEFKINYVQPALLNDDLKGIGEILKQGNRILTVKGDIYNQKNELVATSLATLNAYPIEKSGMLNQQ
jgi:uncharacterized protein (TIGR00369 family)